MATNEEPEKAAAKIASELSELDSILPGELERILPFPSAKVNYAKFWEIAKHIPDFFRSSHLQAGVHDKLWGKFQELCERAKRLQAHERGDQIAESSRNCSLIKSTITDATHAGADAKNIGDLGSARTKLGQATQLMKERFLLKNDREVCWEAWNEASEGIFRRQESIYEDNYINIEKGNLSLIGSLLGRCEPYEAIKYIKETQAKIKELDLTKDQRRWLRESIQRLWDSAIGQIEERKKAKDQERLKREEEYRRQRQ